MRVKGRSEGTGKGERERRGGRVRGSVLRGGFQRQRLRVEVSTVGGVRNGERGRAYCEHGREKKKEKSMAPASLFLAGSAQCRRGRGGSC